jgi:hypothetical protein
MSIRFSFGRPLDSLVKLCALQPATRASGVICGATYEKAVAARYLERKEMNVAERDFELVSSFGIDHGELDGMRPQECFVLGYELAQTDMRLATPEPIVNQPVHATNKERIEKRCIASGRQFRLEWFPDDSSESWMLLNVE